MHIELASMNTLRESNALHIEHQDTLIDGLESCIKMQTSEIELLRTDLQHARQSGVEIQIATKQKLQQDHARVLSRVLEASQTNLHKKQQGI